MRKVDYHMHTYFSADSEENPRNHVLEAIENGLEEICFTEHRDFHFPGMSFDLAVSSYFKEIRALQQEFDSKIIIKIGLEMGLDSRFKKEINDFVHSVPFDFVIGSVHEINDCEVYDHTGYYEEKSKQQAQQMYFEAVLDCIRTFDCFNSLGHLDYVARYGPYEDKSIDFEQYEGIIRQIAKELVAKNKGMEVNTRLFQLKKTQTFYHFFLEQYVKAGGKIVTLGTDSHIAQRDWSSVSLARQLIADAGITSLSTFTKQILD